MTPDATPASATSPARGGGSGSRRTSWLWRGAFVLACLVQLYGLYAPRQAGPDTGIPYSDKVAHLLIFAAVAYLGLRAHVPARWLVLALVANAVASEFIQHYLLPLRSGDPFDALADLAGVAFGTWLAGRARRGTKGGGHDMMGA